MRLSSSIGAAEAEELASARFDLDVLSPATSAAAESSTTRPSRINCLRMAGIRRSRNSSLFRDINPKLRKSCGKKPFTTEDAKEHRGIGYSSEHRAGVSRRRTSQN